jgi:hypothetical protein
MNDEPTMSIYRCLNRAQQQGWPRRYLSFRVGPDVMAYFRRQMARLLREHPVSSVSRTTLWGRPFDVDASLAPNQVVVLDPNGEVVGSVFVPL